MAKCNQLTPLPFEGLSAPCLIEWLESACTCYKTFDKEDNSHRKFEPAIEKRKKRMIKVFISSRITCKWKSTDPRRFQSGFGEERCRHGDNIGNYWCRYSAVGRNKNAGSTKVAVFARGTADKYFCRASGPSAVRTVELVRHCHT